MAKKNKKGNTLNSVKESQDKKASLLSRFSPTIGRLDREDGTISLTSDESENDPMLYSKAEDLFKKLEENIGFFDEKTGELERSIENYKEQSKRSVVLARDNEEKAKELSRQAEKINEQKDAFELKIRELATKESSLNTIELDLDSQRRNAETGFAEVERKYIESGKHHLAALEHVLKSERADLRVREERLAQNEQGFQNGLVSEASSEVKALLDQKNVLEVDIENLLEERMKADQGLENKKRLIDRKENALNAKIESEKEWRNQIINDLTLEVEAKTKGLEYELEQATKSKESAFSQVSELQEKLRKFDDFKRIIGDVDPAAYEEENSRNRSLVKELQEKISGSDVQALEDRKGFLEDRVSILTDQNQELQRELNEVSNENQANRLSIREKVALQSEKKILELGSKKLQLHVDELERSLDGLIEKQQGNNAFPALNKLDEMHRNPSSNLQNVPKLTDFTNQIRMGLVEIDRDNPLFYRLEDIRLFIAGLAMSSLHILQGMSGTGKTSLAMAFSKVVGGHPTLVAVQAGWRDKDDLIGHYNSFDKKYYERETLQAIYRAQTPEYKDRLNIIVLDEMNLSRPEQYFSELLSAMELKFEDRHLVLLEQSSPTAPLLFEEGRKLKVPDNVWFVGTANHDETTNEFADKTYDRAHVMEIHRNTDEIDTKSYEANVTYSYGSLKASFDSAVKKHRIKVSKALDSLKSSKFAEELERNFDVSWGNRLDRHGIRFISVIIECGGTIEEGLDHLLSTKILRRGKVTGRYDINEAGLESLKEALEETWTLELEFKGSPSGSLNVINKDIERLERNS